MVVFHKNQKEVVFEAGEPLTDEEFNSGVHGKAGNNVYYK